MWRQNEFGKFLFGFLRLQVALKNPFADNSSSAGFMTDHQESPAPDKKGKGARRLQNVCPVVIAQIKNQTGDDFKLFGMPAQIVSTYDGW